MSLFLGNGDFSLFNYFYDKKLMDLSLNELCRRSREVVIHAGDFIQEQLGKVSGNQIEEKSLNSLVSYVDKTAEEKLAKGLGGLLPGATFLTEEAAVENRPGELQWIIDPLDGTTNFLFQLPVFSISVALRQGGRTVLGIVYEINRKECFYAWKGGGAFLNGAPIKVSQRGKLAESLLATGFPYYDFQRVQSYLKVFEYFMGHTRGIRRFGSAAVDLAYVACGRFDGFFEYSLHAWDVAAGAFIVQEAGGRVCDFQGGDNYLFGKEMISSNGLIHDELLEVIREGFYVR